MKPTNPIFKIAALCSFFVLLTAFVSYRSGAFDSPAQGGIAQDSSRPDSLKPEFIPSSKSMSPLIGRKVTPTPSVNNAIADTTKPEIIAPSSKSGKIFSNDDIRATSSKSGAIFEPKDVKPPVVKPKKTKKSKKKPMMGGSKSAEIISPQ